MNIATPLPTMCSPTGIRASVGACVYCCVRACIGLYVSAALSASVARAALPPLPPLPGYMPLDDAVAAADTEYGAVPLPRAQSSEVSNPFRDDAADDSAGSR